MDETEHAIMILPACMVQLVVHPDNPELRVDNDECMHALNSAEADMGK